VIAVNGSVPCPACGEPMEGEFVMDLGGYWHWAQDQDQDRHVCPDGRVCAGRACCHLDHDPPWHCPKCCELGVEF
jgi:hypothetical protein